MALKTLCHIVLRVNFSVHSYSDLYKISTSGTKSGHFGQNACNMVSIVFKSMISLT